MLASVLITYYGTLKKSKDVNKFNYSFTIHQIFNQILNAFRTKSFILFFLGYLFIALSWGLSSSLQLYVTTFFWEFDTSKLTFFIPIYASASVLAFYILSLVSNIFEKRTLILFALLIASIMHAIPVPCAVGLSTKSWIMEFVFCHRTIFIGNFNMSCCFGYYSRVNVR